MLTALLVVGGSVLVALAGMLVVRRLVSYDTLRQHNEVAGFVYAAVAVAYGALLAFVVVAVWENHHEAQDAATREVEALAALHRVAQGLPGEAGQDLTAIMAAYLRSVTDDEWRMMAAGREDARSRRLLDEMWAALWRVDPRSAREANTHAEALGRLTALGAARRERLLDAREHAPPLLWWSLVVGGAVTVGFTYLFGVKSAVAQALMTAALTTTLALGLLMIIALNHPFRGELGIEPDAFSDALHTLAPER